MEVVLFRNHLPSKKVQEPMLAKQRQYHAMAVLNKQGNCTQPLVTMCSGQTLHFGFEIQSNWKVSAR
jgi:hypothetical protein